MLTSLFFFLQIYIHSKLVIRDRCIKMEMFKYFTEIKVDLQTLLSVI